MTFREKGDICLEFPEEFIVFDFETTGRDYGKKIVQIGAIKVCHEEIIDSFHSLVNPQIHIPRDASDIHGITDDIVSSAPVIKDIIESFLEFIGTLPLVGYNCASFDYNLLYDEAKENLGQGIHNDYIDVMHMVQRTDLPIENKKLTTVCEHYHIRTTHAHDALSDCKMTLAVYNRLQQEFGAEILIPKDCRSRGKNYRQHFSKETAALREFEGFIKGILADGKVSDCECIVLKDWMDSNKQLAGNYPFDNIFEVIEGILEDNIISVDELSMLKDVLEGSLDPLHHLKHDEICQLSEKHCCITGDFDYGVRSKVEELLQSQGAIIDNTVKKCTDYVIVGNKGSDSWKCGNYGGKIKKAMELQAKGLGVQIVSETDFFSEIKLLESED